MKILPRPDIVEVEEKPKIYKSLHQRQLEYENVRAKIFGEVSDLKKIRNFNKIKKLRDRHHRLKRIRKKIVSTIVTLKGDSRMFAKTKVGGVEVLALLDSGASTSCIGKNAAELLKKNQDYIMPIKDEKVRTADGGVTPVTGFITLPVVWDGEQRDMEFCIVPALEQTVYFGIDFWHTFELDLLSKKTAKNCDKSCDTLCNINHDKIGDSSSLISEINLSEKDEAIALNQHVLSPDQEKKLEQVKNQFPSFAKLGLGKTTLEEHVIEVTDENTPIKQRYYPISPAIQKLMYDELDRMIGLGVIEESNSAWSSPVTLVCKPGKNRLCLDARKVNERTVKDAYPLPHIEGILSRLQDTKYISALDLKDAFWQIPLEQKSREKTAFTVPGRALYQYTVMPFGLCNAAQRMCRLMDKTIPGKLKEKVFVYLDDLLVCSATFEEHLVVLEEVAKCLTRANLTINVEKSKFCYQELKYLGFIVGNGHIKTDESKVAAVRDFPEPKSPKQLRRFLGMSGWYRRFIKDYATLAAPLHDCLKKDKLKKFALTEAAITAFNRIKQAMISAPVLVNPDFEKHFYIQCDASSEGVGGVLFQIDVEDNERPIAYMSTKLNKAQRNYSVTELECYAAILSVKKFRPYVEGLPFTIITDHASLKWLMSQKDLTGRLARWSLKLQCFNFNIMHRKGSENIVPDTLSRIHMDEIRLIGRELDIDLNSPHFQSEEYQELIKYVKENKDSVPDICESDGFVYKRTQFATGDPIQEDKAWKLWVPSELREKLLEQSHYSESVGHGGINKTLERLRIRYYWPGMVKDVQEVVKNCEVCKCCKSTNFIKRPPMGAQQITERPFQRLYIDFMGPYPRSKDGSAYLFVCLDHFSKFVLLKPMRKAVATEVIKYLEQDVFHIFGVPEFVHSDNGKQFISEIFKNFLAKYGVSHIKTAFYSPQANASERVNRSILQIIRSFLKENQTSWSAHVSDAAFALRSAIHSGINLEPYYALFGLHMMQHGASYEVSRRLSKIGWQETKVMNIADKQQLIRDWVIKELGKAHERAAKTYNTRSREIKFKEGQIVYRKNYKQSDQIKRYNAKLAPMHIKCIVLKCIGNSLYELGNITGKKLGIYHAKDLFTA